MADVAAVVVAAGQGLRAGGDTPKQFRAIGGQTMLRRTLSLLAGAPMVRAIQPRSPSLSSSLPMGSTWVCWSSRYWMRCSSRRRKV